MATPKRPAEMRERDRGQYGSSGLQELIDLADRLFRAETQLEEHPDDEATRLDLENVRLEQELFFAEHDNAGAFKFNKLGRRVQQLFEAGPNGRAAIETDADGRFIASEAHSRRRFLFVNMGELDRFNKEGGGHGAGDAALSATAAHIERLIGEALKGKEGKEAEYAVYRYDGNTFAVDLADISEEDADALGLRLRDAQPSVKGVTEAAPLAVGALDFSEVIALLNHLQAELPPGAKIESGEEAARELVEVLRRAADWQMEAAKFEKRAERMHDKIVSKDPEAKAFFENYIKKAFQGTEFSSFEAFATAAEDTSFPDIVQRLALAAAERRFAEGREVDDQFQEIVDGRVRARGIPPDLPKAETAVLPGKLETSGDRILAAKEAEMKARAAEAARDPEDELAARRAKNAKLKHQVEAARRDRGTGLFSRGAHYENLENALEENRDVAVVFVDMGFLKYFDQMGGTAVGDGALKTAAVLMEQALENAGIEGRVYRYGGDEFTVQVEGGAEAATRFMAALEALRAASEPISKGPKSLAEYAPTRLSFNCGLADRAMLDELERAAIAGGDLSAEDLADPEILGNLRAELMTKAADAGIEYDKAYSRFMLLVRELRDPEAVPGTLRRKQLDALIGFSNKAIFAEIGGADHLLNLAADRSLEGEALEEAVLEYVLAKVGETRQREKNKREFLDTLLAAQTRVSFLKAHVVRLQNRIAALEQVNDQQGEQLHQAILRRDKAEEDRRRLIETRGAIDAAA